MSFSLLSSLLLCSIAETEIASAGLVPSGACRGYPWWLLDMVNSVMTGRARSGEVPWHSSCPRDRSGPQDRSVRSEEHTSELQSLMRISYAVFCLKKKNRQTKIVHK